jgi:hypothetical protein
MFYSDHNYELVLETNNTSKTNQDIKHVYIYLRKELGEKIKGYYSTK